jgi:hypothetical protein
VTELIHAVRVERGIRIVSTKVKTLEMAIEEEVSKESILIKYSGGLNELSSAEEPGNYSQATPDIVFPTHLYPHAAQANPFVEAILK